MSYLYLFSNIALLLPLRDPILVALTVVVLAAIALFISARTAHQRTEVKTREGMIALLIQFLPLGVLLGRTIWLYSPESILYTTALLMSFVALRQCSVLLDVKSKIRGIMEMASSVVAMLAGLSMFVTLMVADVPAALSMIIGTSVAAILVYELSTRAGRNNGRYRVLATGIAVSGLVLNMLVTNDLYASLITIVIGLAMTVYSYTAKQKSIFIGGVITTLAGAMEQVTQIMLIFNFGYWVTLAIIGVFAIVVGSMLESKGGRLRQTFHGMKTRYAEWNY